MDTNENHNKSILQFLIITYTFTWLAWLPGVLSSYDLIPDLPWLPFFALGICGPLVAALWVLKKEGHWANIWEWLRAGFRKRFGWQWWLMIIAIPLLVPPLSILIFRLTGGTVAEMPFFKTPWILLPTFLLMVTIGGGNEEFGWRGFLLPRLLERFTPVQSDLILTIVHSCWHIPLFFNVNTTQYTYPFWLFLIFGMGFTPLINRVYRFTGGSILAAMLFHGLTNTSMDSFPPVSTWVNDSPIPLILIGSLFFLCTIMLDLFAKNHKPKEG